jgi:hypothetical protein
MSYSPHYKWPRCFTAESDASPGLFLVKDISDVRVALKYAKRQGACESFETISDMASKSWIALNQMRGPSVVWASVDPKFLMAVFDIVHETAWEELISPTFSYKNDQGKWAVCAFVVIRDLTDEDEEHFDATCAGDAKASSNFLLGLFFKENPGFLLTALKDTRAARYIKSRNLHRAVIRSGLERIVWADMEKTRHREKRLRTDPGAYRRVRWGEEKKKKSVRMSAQGFQFKAPALMIDLTLQDFDFAAPVFSAFTGQQLEPIFAGL